MTRRAAILLLPAAVPACRPRATRGQPAARTIADSTGRQVALPACPQHVLSLSTAVTDTLVRLGEGGRLAGIDEFSRIIPGTAAVPVLGKGSTLSREQVIARAIDLAFVWWYQDAAAAMLEGCGLPVVRVRCARAAEIPATVRLVGRCLGCDRAADRLAAGVHDELARLAATPPPPDAPTVYLELYGPFRTGGRDSYVNDLIELAGGRNVAASAPGAVLLSAEQLLAANPDHILLLDGITGAASFAARPGMHRLAAVRSGRVHALDRGALVAGAGIAAGVARLHSLLERPAAAAPPAATPLPPPTTNH